MIAKRILEGRLYENQSLHSTAGSFSTAWLCRGSTHHGHNYDHNPRGDDDRAGHCACHSASNCNAAATGRSSRDGDGGAGSGLCVDTRVLALDGNTVRLDARQLGSASCTNCCLGGRPMGTTHRWMGVGPRPLAVGRLGPFPPALTLPDTVLAVSKDDQMTFSV
jgi:hypothetical protein